METWLLSGIIVAVLFFSSQVFFLEWDVVRDSWKERPFVGITLLVLQIVFWPYWSYRVFMAWYTYFNRKRKEA